MFQRISRVFAKPVVEAGFRLYFRDTRPVALQGAIFSDLVVASIYETLVGSGLNWIFESTRTGQPVGNVELAPPEHRDRLQVTSESISTLQADLVERNIHGFRRFVALYGGTSELLKLTEDEALHNAVEAFADGRVSPIKTLIIQFGDVVPDVIYYSSSDSKAVELLFPGLGIPPADQVRKLKYKDLKGEDLETAMAYLSCAEHDH